MNTLALIEQARSVGVELALVDGKVRAIGTQEALNRLIEPLRQHKGELTKWLIQSGNNYQRGQATVGKRLPQDERILCCECNNLEGSGPSSWRCGNWRLAGISIRAKDADLPSDLVQLPQRCPGFQPAITKRAAP